MLLIAHNWRPVIQTELVRQHDLMRADALLPEHDIKAAGHGHKRGGAIESSLALELSDSGYRSSA
jgi:hypothetical protein